VKKKTEDLLFHLGSTSLTLGLLSVTVLPFAIRPTETLVMPLPITLKFACFLFYATGAILYLLSFNHYKSQLSWLGKLALFYIVFQIFYLFYIANKYYI